MGDEDTERVDTENDGVRLSRRQALAATGAAGLAGLAGCTGGGSNNGGTPTDSGGSGGTSDGGSGGTATQQSMEDPLSDRDSIRIGVLAPVPSSNPIGGSIANGAKLAAKQLNENGGIGGATVEVVVKNTEEAPQTGRSRYGELVRDENVDLTTGVFTSEVLLAIMDDIAGAKIPHMTAGAATPEASARVKENYDKYKYHFRTGPINAHHLGQNMVDFLDAKNGDLGWESVAVLVEDYKWTEPVSAVLEDKLSDTGVDITMTQRYASGTEDFNPIYNKVENSGADAAFIAMAHTGTPAVIQWAKQQRPFEFGGIHVPMQLPSYYDAVKGACAYGVTQNSATPTSKVTDKTVPFANAYHDEFDSYPVYTGYITFDAVKQYATVLEESGDVGADAVVAGLEESSYTGTAGTIEYYGRDNEFAHDVKYGQDTVWPIFQQWQPDGSGSGTQEVIFPDNLATADYQSPSWI